MDLVDVYRTFHPTSTQYTFFSAAHGTFFKIDHILGYKASLSKYKKIEITPSKATSIAPYGHWWNVTLITFLLLVNLPSFSFSAHSHGM
jgi:hypothetical protein